MFANDPDRDWQNWGKTDPYFGVLTETKFLNVNLNDSALAEFFASGERHVEHVYEVIRTRVRPDFKPGRVLDYGCGAGRLVVAFAARSREVVGVDVASSMLEVARANCKRLGADSVDLMHVTTWTLLRRRVLTWFIPTLSSSTSRSLRVN